MHRVFGLGRIWWTIRGQSPKTTKSKHLNIRYLDLFSSDPPGARTQDPILKRDVLYQLS